MITEALNNLYQSYTGNLAETIEELPFSSSNRRYFRLSGVKNLIGVSGTSIEENKAFIYMAEHFRKKGLPIPEVYCASEDHSFYLQEDLGDMLLFNAIEKGRTSSVFDEQERELLKKRLPCFPPFNLPELTASTSPNAIHRQNSTSDPSSGISTILNTVS